MRNHLAFTISGAFMEFETVIGLETHIQLSTESKIFCTSSTLFGARPNEHVNPVTMGMPGCLPVLNKKVVEYAIMLGLATGCEIRRFNRFARKHYFYPDLPKGYQISQYDEPICERGEVRIRVQDVSRSIGICRIHMEEDAGKNIHDPASEASLIDLNRAGVPLLEIVTDPDLRSAAEASAYLKTLRQLVRYLGISDGNMEQGSLRCDANISLRPVGTLTFGTRTEIKNINSFRFVEKALEYEIARQLKLLRNGEKVVQETRLFDSSAGVTKPMRSKEESADYRYFPDPDLPPVIVEESWIKEVKDNLPTLPSQYFTELTEKHGLSPYDAEVLISEADHVQFFFEVSQACGNAKLACNWITSELFGLLNKEAIELKDSPISSAALGELLKLIEDETISGKMAKAVFEEMFTSGKAALTIVEERGLKQITDESAIVQIVDSVIAQNPSQLKGYVEGNDRLFGFFVGQVMKASKGSANPQKVNEVLRRILESKREG
jgi:aspartyl-tRNA(Asn)/glutamyl-tRNA(Gln) amidotransferase subunit B